MAQVDDILHNPQGDLVFVNGDFSVGDSDAQHIQDIVQAMPGDYRQSPLVGVGIMSYLNSPTVGNYTELRGNIRLQLLADGYQQATIKLGRDMKTLNIVAER